MLKIIFARGTQIAVKNKSKLNGPPAILIQKKREEKIFLNFIYAIQKKNVYIINLIPWLGSCLEHSSGFDHIHLRRPEQSKPFLGSQGTTNHIHLTKLNQFVASNNIYLKAKNQLSKVCFCDNRV